MKVMKMFFAVAALSCLSLTASAQNFGSEEQKKEKKSVNLFSLGYFAEDCSSIKESGHYGYSMTLYNWGSNKVKIGFDMRILAFNFGLVNSSQTSDMLGLGPAVGFIFNRHLALSIPADVNCNLRFKEGEDSRANWSLSIAPALYVGKKVGFYFGPFLSVPFSSGGSNSVGFRVGLAIRN